MRSDRGVLEQQTSEGKVLASSAGRVLTVPVSIGRAVMLGETIATVTEDKYILRLQLPERHARFLRAGDTVQIGGRGFEESGREVRRPVACASSTPRFREDASSPTSRSMDSATISSASARASILPTGKRKAIFLPRASVYRRAGVDLSAS